MAADDWCLLFTAVCDRLLAAAAAAPPGDPLARTVAEAVQALRSLIPQPALPGAADPVSRDGRRCGSP